MKNQIILLAVVNILSSLGYSLIAPLFPSIALQKGVSEFIIGLIFSCFAISNVITIPNTPYLIKVYGRLNLMYFSLIIESSCTMMFAILDYFDNPFFFATLAIITRLMHGVGSALSSTLVYSIAASLCDEDEIKSAMGYMELSYSLGLTIGPAVGSILYHFFGYSYAFNICGIFMLICVPFIKYLEVNQDEFEEIDFFKVLFNPNILMTFLTIVIDMLTATFFLPVFSLHLRENFGLSIEVSSIFFIISMLSYFITLQFLNGFNNIFGIKLTITLGLIINGIGVLMIHPINFFPQNIVVIVLGLIIIGISGAFITIPGIVDFMDSLKIEMNVNDNSANDIASAMYNFAVNTGEALGPTFGGIMTNLYKFESTCKTTSLINIVFALLFSLMNYKMIKSHFIITNKDENQIQVDNEYVNIKYVAVESDKNHIKDKISFTPKCRGYSFSSLSSKRNSINMMNG